MPSLQISELHPMIVHFPIALLLVSVVLDIIALLLRRWNIAYAATWCLLFGVIGAMAAGVTGPLAERAIGGGQAGGTTLAMHKLFAMSTGLVFGALLIIRLIYLSPRILGNIKPWRPALFGAIDARLRALVPVLYAPAPPALLVGVYLFASLFGTVLLALTGHYGGALVYNDHLVR